MKSGRRPIGPSPPKPWTCVRYVQPVVSGDECPGRFEREFDILDEDFGSGEFGHVLKVRRKAGDGDDFGLVGAKEGGACGIRQKPIGG